MSILGKIKRKWKKELIYNPKRFYWVPAHSAHHKMMSLPFNMLFRFVRAFLPKSKHLLISWLQSPSAVIWEPKKIKSVTTSTSPPSGRSVTKLCSTLATPWTIAHQAPLSRLLCPWDFPDKNSGMGCHFLLQGIFPTQKLNLGLLHCRRILYQLSYEGTHLLFAMKSWDQVPWSWFFECWVLSQLFYSPLSPSSRGSLVLLHFLQVRVAYL